MRDNVSLTSDQTNCFKVEFAGNAFVIENNRFRSRKFLRFEHVCWGQNCGLWPNRSCKYRLHFLLGSRLFFLRSICDDFVRYVCSDVFFLSLLPVFAADFEA